MKCPIGNACGINVPVAYGCESASAADDLERILRRALVLLVHTKQGVEGAADVMQQMKRLSGLCALHSLWNRYTACGIDSLDKVLDAKHTSVLAWSEVCRAWMDSKRGIDRTDVLKMAKEEIVAHVKALTNNKTPETGTYELFDKACRKVGCSDGSEIVNSPDGRPLEDL